MKLNKQNKNSDALLKNLPYAKKRLKEKLLALNLSDLGISEYTQQYLQKKFKKIDGTLDLYDYILTLCFSDSQFSLNTAVFVDYGGGSGILSYLAKEVGIGTVIYIDIYDQSCNDTIKISKTLKLPIDHVVCGDVEELLQYIHSNSITVDALASFDVLKHIYDINDHFKKLASITHPFRIVYASGANIRNPYASNHLKKQQLFVEYHDREENRGHKQRDTLKAYYTIRKEIIHSYSPDLDEETINFIAQKTRGLREEDIKKSVDEYKEKGQITYSIDHPTNTCDPYTGNWCEHLIRIEWFEQNIAQYGYSVKVINGYWNATSTFSKKALSAILNFFIKLLGKHSLIISPYYVVIADYNGKPVYSGK